MGFIHWQKKNTNGIPRNIRCPECNARRYFIRPETKRYIEDGEAQLQCSCGAEYLVIKHGVYSVIRRKA